MYFLAITDETINWILGNNNVLNEICKILPSWSTNFNSPKSVYAAGPLRIIPSPDEGVCVICNVDYLSGSGTERWGFISLDSDTGLLKQTDIIDKTFQRCLQVIRLRLSALVVPEDYIHRKLEEGIHSCLAGGGLGKASQLSIGYVEYNSAGKAIACTGPFRELDKLKNIAFNYRSRIHTWFNIANTTLNNYSKRPIIDDNILDGIRSIPHIILSDAPKEIPEFATILKDTPADYSTRDFTYDDWFSKQSPLTEEQRRIIDSQTLQNNPLRIMGAAGSGKTLTMQLLVMHLLNNAERLNKEVSIVYFTHNSEICNTITERFLVLGAEKYLCDERPQKLNVSTLFSYSTDRLGIAKAQIIDKDASQTKAYQYDEIKKICLKIEKSIQELPLLGKLNDLNYQSAIINLIVNEISAVIKGRGLEGQEEQYVSAESSYSRFHGALSIKERKIVYNIFKEYHKEIFEINNMLDSDDIAISALSYLRTPLWQLKRKKMGFDYVFVDETQLFNQNERALFQFVTKEAKPSPPIALALDDAQNLRAVSQAGLGTVGINDVRSETLFSVHRSTQEILSLAFAILNHSDDLFTADFPSFISTTKSMVKEKNPLIRFPTVYECHEKQMCSAITDKVCELRNCNYRRIAIIVHSEDYWDDIVEHMKKQKKITPFILDKRGENLPDSPIVVLSRPDYVGGQEFDAVLCIGLEHGVYPKIIAHDNVITHTLEQQAIREMYLASA